METEKTVMDYNSDILALKNAHQIEMEKYKVIIKSKEEELEKINQQISSLNFKCDNLNSRLKKETVENHTLRTNLQRNKEKMRKLKKKVKQAAFVVPKPQVTEEDEAKLKDTLSSVLDPASDIESETMLEITPILKTELGGRLFTQMLSQHFLTGSYVKPCSHNLSDAAFLRVLFLANNLLSVLDVTNPADYISCKVLLQISRVVYHEVENGKETMERLLQSHYFQNVEFWEEYFWDVISNKYQKKFGDISEDYSKKEKEWLLKKMASFLTVLQDRGLPKDTLADLTKKLTDTIQADSDKLQSRKSENSLPKLFNRGFKSENSLPSLDSSGKLISVAEKRKSRMSCKKEIESLQEIPSIPEPKKRTSQKKRSK